MSDRFSILLAGELSLTDRLREQIAGTRIVAADGGMAHADALGVVPELWVGDFDSSPEGLQSSFQDVPRQQHPMDKDASDGELAIAHVEQLGAKELLLVGGLGGQMDHALAHMMMLLRAHERGLRVGLTSGHEEAWPLLDQDVSLDLGVGTRISVLPMSDLTGLNISGVRWPLEQRDVPMGATLTLSNEIVEPPARVSLGEGRAIVLVYP